MGFSTHARVVVCLGVAQTLAWASTYYLPAIVAQAMALDLGVSTSTVFLAFSLALLVAAGIGPQAGRSIDRWGGRPVLSATSVVFAIGLALLGSAHGPIQLFVAWIVLGVGMGGGLYEAAFSVLVRLYGPEARSPITGITLIAGFASTVGWPLSSLLLEHYGWRGVCFGWASLHVLLGLPLNLMTPRTVAALADQGSSAPTSSATTRKPRLAAVLLAIVFGSTWFVSTAMAAHLPRLLGLVGASVAVAVLVGALIGPAQVVGRVIEFSFLRRLHPLISARLAAVLHPIGAMLLMVFGAPVAMMFAILHGAGNGVLTIANGTLPLVLFGPVGYGKRQGLLMIPARFAQASAPFLFGLALDHWQAGALYLSAGLGIVSSLSLAWLSTTLIRPAREAAPAL